MIRGGNKLERYLTDTANRLGNGGTVRVGYLEGATYPNEKGKSAKALSVATVAFWNNWGTVRSPARPFFTNMIAANSPKWSEDLAKAVLNARYDTRKALALMGVRINDQLVKAVVDWPADNAPYTVAKKGFNKGLIDQGIMQRSSDYEVVT